jgi:hypothetical protein
MYEFGDLGGRVLSERWRNKNWRRIAKQEKII